MSAANGDDVFGRLPFNAGGPSRSLPSSTSRHKLLNHYREYSQESLISQTNSFDFGNEYVYDINVKRTTNAAGSEMNCSRNKTMNATTTRNTEAKVRYWTEILNANRNAETPDGHDAYEEAAWNLRQIKRT